MVNCYYCGEQQYEEDCTTISINNSLDEDPEQEQEYLICPNCVGVISSSSQLFTEMLEGMNAD